MFPVIGDGIDQPVILTPRTLPAFPPPSYYIRKESTVFAHRPKRYCPFRALTVSSTCFFTSLRRRPPCATDFPAVWFTFCRMQPVLLFQFLRDTVAAAVEKNLIEPFPVLVHAIVTMCGGDGLCPSCLTRYWFRNRVFPDTAGDVLQFRICQHVVGVG